MPAVLFDLRGRGRRRTVKVIYSGLAALMAIALIGFGLGGAFGGGSVFESLSKEGGEGGSSYSSEITKLEKKIKKDPSDASLWAQLTKVELRASTGNEYYDSTTNVYTTKGKEQLRRTARAWEHYLALESKKPSVRLAKDMSNIFAAEALDEPAKEVEALQIIIGAPGEKPTEEHYYLLSYYAFLAHNEALGKLAMKKTLTFVPKVKRPQIEVELERVAKAAAEETSTTATSTSTTATSTTSTAATGSKSSGK